MSSVKTVPMVTELRKAGVELDMSKQGEQLTNYILHMYNVFMMPAPWESAAEAAALVYRYRKARNQVWQTKWRRT
jgi:hypothetical protein